MKRTKRLLRLGMSITWMKKMKFTVKYWRNRWKSTLTELYICQEFISERLMRCYKNFLSLVLKKAKKSSLRILKKLQIQLKKLLWLKMNYIHLLLKALKKRLHKWVTIKLMKCTGIHCLISLIRESKRNWIVLFPMGSRLFI